MYTGLLLLFGLWATSFVDDPVLSVELTLQTRGTRKSISVNARQTRVDINGNVRQTATPPKQWSAILTALKKINLTDLSSLQTTTSRSAVDAALSARIQVTTTSQTYESAPYDHPHPPQEVTALVDAIIGSAPSASRNEFR